MERLILKLPILVLSLSAWLSGCTLITPQISEISDTEIRVKTADPAPVVVQPTHYKSQPVDLWDRIRSQTQWAYPDHPSINEQREHYLQQLGLFEALSERASWYLYYIVEQVEARDLPIELALLPIVESTLLPEAMSHRSAAGLWQIMPRTGTHLGLTQNWWYDGRLDIRASTDAALTYLQHLHDRFDGDWLLALSAYNAGETRVRRAQRANAKRGLPTDYWSLSLPRETRHYLPRLLALTQIVQQPERYNVTLATVPNQPAFASVPLSGQIEVKQFAQSLALQEHELRRFNPGILRWATDPNGVKEVLVPMHTMADAHAIAQSTTAVAPVQWHRYTIKNGDSLIKIARQFGVEVALLRAANDITGSLIRTGKTLMIPVGDGTAHKVASSDDQRSTLRYTVRPGDSLYKIASRFQTSISNLVVWNGLDPADYLKPGQRLTLFPSES